MKWVNEVEAAEEERQRMAPPIDLSNPMGPENAAYRKHALAIQKHSHLAEQGKKLLAEFLRING